ncbi:hypothetical protein JYT20_00595 [Rhodothermus sp. AH-315-K08]|nr:hypothetical protein [Rhodothermus sp. AH-315-K08]
MNRASVLLAGSLVLTSATSAQEVTLTEFKARNGVGFEYAILEPAGFDADEPHAVLFAFPPGDMDRAAVQWSVDNLWGDADARGDWVIVIPTIPRDSWHTHPAHHALDEFLDELKARYNTELLGLHLTGYSSGARAAITYASMSSKYWSSLTVAGPSPWNRWDAASIRRWPTNNKHIPIHILVGEHDAEGLAAVERVEKPFRDGGVSVRTTVVPGYGQGLESMLGGGMLAAISATASH